MLLIFNKPRHHLIAPHGPSTNQVKVAKLAKLRPRQLPQLCQLWFGMPPTGGRQGRIIMSRTASFFRNRNSAAKPVQPNTDPPVPKSDGLIWDGEPLVGKTLTIDIETAGGQITTLPRQMPRLVLASAADRDRSVMVPHGRIDVLVLAGHLGDEAREAMLSLIDEDRIRDTFCLADAIEKFETGQERSGTGTLRLDNLAEKHLGRRLDKTLQADFASVEGKPLESVPPEYLRYEAADARVTLDLYWALKTRSEELLLPFQNEIDQQHVRRFGPFCNSINTKASIVLSEMQDAGVHVDQQRRAEIAEGLATETGQTGQRLESAIVEVHTDGGPLLANDCLLFKRTKVGSLVRTSNGAPSIDKQKVLIPTLQHVAAQIGIDVPRTVKGQPSTKAEFWQQHADRHRLLSVWLDYKKISKLLEFVTKYSERVVYPRINYCVRTGRTAYSSPNVQQLPKSHGYRSMIVAPLGHVFIKADYSFIELVTLAAHCRRQFGFSKLGDVIEAGRDPHGFTAALFRNMEYEEFIGLKDTDPARFKEWRQRAKACNFVLPGGLGPERLARTAKASFGVEMSVDEARELKRRICEEIYPEIGKHLSEDNYRILAYNFDTDVETVRGRFPIGCQLGSIRKIISDKDSSAERNEDYADNLWDGLASLCNRSKLRRKLEIRQAGDDLKRDLMNFPAVHHLGFARGRTELL